ncbi:unnamed protein product [Calypogeia fissa]
MAVASRVLVVGAGSHTLNGTSSATAISRDFSTKKPSSWSCPILHSRLQYQCPLYRSVSCKTSTSTSTSSCNCISSTSICGRNRRTTSCFSSKHAREWHFGQVGSKEIHSTRARTRTRTRVRAIQGIDGAKGMGVNLDVERKRPLKPIVERFNIYHEKNVSEERLKELGVSRWSKWDCGPGVTTFWKWKVDELVYISKGSVEVVPDGCFDAAYFYAGDLVRFPKWFEATWTFDKHFEMYYKFFAYGD